MLGDDAKRGLEALAESKNKKKQKKKGAAPAVEQQPSADANQAESQPSQQAADPSAPADAAVAGCSIHFVYVSLL